MREFVFEPNKVTEDAAKKLRDEAEEQRLKLLLSKWCDINFAEAFKMMMHLKAVRVFVESVLRYGLTPKATGGMGAGPGPNFQSVLLQPKKGKEDHLHKALHALYGGGSAINIDVRTPLRTPSATPLRTALRTAHHTAHHTALHTALRTPLRTPLPPLHLCRRTRRRCPARRASSTRTSSCRWTRRRQAWPRLSCSLLAGPEQGQRRACGVDAPGFVGGERAGELQRGRV